MRGGASDLVLRARPLETNRSLRVSVVLPDGGPAHGALVHAIHRQMSVSELTDAEGVALLRGLPDRPLELRVSPRGTSGRTELPAAEARLRDVVPGDDTLKVVLQRTVRLLGRVVDEQGRGVASVKVHARPADGGRPSAASAPDGQFGFALHPTDAFPLDLEVVHVTATGALLTAQVRVVSSDALPTLVLRRAASAHR